jgi:hypothetical protein
MTDTGITHYVLRLAMRRCAASQPQRRNWDLQIELPRQPN